MADRQPPVFVPSFQAQTANHYMVEPAGLIEPSNNGRLAAPDKG
jgi:hypothetical protein